jgi:hypothetical protein
VLPRGAEPPKPTPEFTSEQAITCPSVSITPSAYPSSGEPMQFDVAYRVKDSDIKPTFSWEVLNGEITKGQGSATVTIEPSKGNAEDLVVKVRAVGFSIFCDESSTSDLVTIPPKLEAFVLSGFGEVTQGVIRAHLDGFMNELRENPDFEGNIIIYAPRENGKRDSAARMKMIKNQLAFRNFDTSRVTFTDGGYREEIWTEFWLVKKGAQHPKPRPTLDSKYAIPRKLR